MLFNSFEYIIFFPLVVALYFVLPYRWRWAFLLAASYYFYMCWRVEYIFLIMASTLVDYLVGLKMGKIKEKKKRRKYLYLSLIINLGLLFVFKYYNFFSENVNETFSHFNIFYNLPEFNLLLPVGISFYTFQTIGYTVDVYKGKTDPETHLGKFALYVSFFPQLVAGPIERSTRLIPQFYKKMDFDAQKVTSGLRLILWGFFKKVVVADRLGVFVNNVFENPTEYNGIPVMIGALLFTFQLYCDFSGYTDIAIGTARLMGYNLMINFNRPYASRSIADFWSRWHISLTTWFKDYLYSAIPFNHKKRHRSYIINIMITFLLIGLWHGSSWTFILWGGLNGFFLIVERLSRNIRRKFFRAIGLTKNSFILVYGSIIFTYVLLSLMCTFFRANSINDAFLMFHNMLILKGFLSSASIVFGNVETVFGIFVSFIVIAVESYHARHSITQWIQNKSVIIRWLIYLCVIIFIVLFGVFQRDNFYYFQF